jgi:N-acetylglutamate synthase-like GNAT family acetyltransferase
MVRPQFQRRGFTSQLVDQGCQVAKVYGAGRLYVYTDVPALYAKLGWEAVTSDSGGSVFTKAMI